MQLDYNPSVQETIECLVTELGTRVGGKIKKEIAAAIGLGQIDTNALKEAIVTVQTILDSDSNADGFQAGKNLISMLSTLTTRVDSLENDTRLEKLQAMMDGFSVSISDETARATAAELAIEQKFDALSSTVVAIQQQLSDSENNPNNGGCDCVAMAADMNAINIMVTNIEASGAAAAVQIASLQTAVSKASEQAQAAATVASQALAAANSAAAAASANAVAIVAVQSQLKNFGEREDERHEGHHGRLTRIEDFKREVVSISCIRMADVFEASMNAAS